MHQLHDYIHSVLESGDHGSFRLIVADKATFNDAIEKHSTQMAALVKADLKKVKPKDEKKVIVKNHLGNVSFDAIVSTPANLQELVEVLARAKREKQKVKAAGSFHAWSPVCVTDGYLIKTDKLTGTNPTPKGTLKNPSQEGLYEILGGTKLKDAVQALEKDGRAFMNLGGYTGQSIVGATSTGTHGSGLSIPPLASMICGLNLVSAQFDANDQPILYRIEPTDGITDRKLHSPPFKLIQDDATFNAVVTGLGAFGVVYSVTITTVPFYWIEETREKVDWSVAKKLLQQGPTGDILKYHNSEVWINAYTSEALITRRRQVTSKPASEQGGASTHVFATLLKELPALRALVREITEGEESVTEDLSEDVGYALAAIFRSFPLFLPTGIHIAFATQVHSDARVAKYYDIYDIGFANYFPAISAEISYPLSTYLPGVDAAIHLLQEFQKKDLLKALLGFLSLRFTSPTSASISMSYSADKQSPGRCYMEVFTIFTFYRNIQGFEDLIRPLAEQSVNQYQGRLHWGQYISPSFQTIQYAPHDPEFYKSIASFKGLAEKYDPEHMFGNDFLKKLIWSVDT